MSVVLSFAKTLEERRLGGQFKHDNIDLQQASGGN